MVEISPVRFSRVSGLNRSFQVMLRSSDCELHQNRQQGGCAECGDERQ